ncbi:hypothetical protein U14_00919 [Candidatus Moduliflexus flocculans]|uniref:Uncharacterized protein n=1 Tax=Candidatus Moduliflexus flocculans TaxID=1499966 RepID=A0A0S6VR86_9BACT|nr:hypothetical protein U14_00919 [Candidatus Moduliflexus flocculans]
MDFPVHVAAGALAGSILLYVCAKENEVSGELTMTRSETFKLGAAGCFFGVLTHLLLDALPYYDWLFYIAMFKPLPYGWAIPTVFVTVPVIMTIFYLNKDARIVAGLSMFGGMYPDIEKLAYFDANLPRFCVLFPFHSCQLSSSRWELSHKYELIVMEICLFALMMYAMIWLTIERKHIRHSLCQAG